MTMANKASNSSIKDIADSDTIEIGQIGNRIYTIRGEQVILDRDLALLYKSETKRLNEQVRRNNERFPPEFMFQLTKEEWDSLRSHFATINGRGHHPKYLPNAFTEYGVIMVAALLKSDIADKASVMIVKAFVAMRRFLAANAQVFHRLDRIEYKQLETDHKIERIFEKLEERSIIPKQDIFFDGQIFDAYQFVSGLIKRAKTEIVLIDNYVDESVLTMLDKRGSSVKATVYTKQVSTQFQLDINKHNAQYASIDVKAFNKAHDRFLIVDDNVYHIGASLKDLGRKWFAFSLMQDLTPQDLLARIQANSEAERPTRGV